MPIPLCRTLCVSVILAICSLFTNGAQAGSPYLTAPNTFSQAEKQELEAALSHIGVHLDFLEAPLSFKQSMTMVQELRSVYDIISPVAPQYWPHDLTLRLHFDGATAQNQYRANRLSAAYSQTDRAGNTLPWEITRLGLLHELGHAVFDLMIVAGNTTYAKLLASKLEFFEVYDRFDRDSVAGTLSPEDKEKLSQEMTRVVQSREPKVSASYDQLGPYSELFADTFAVGITRNPEGISQLTGRFDRSFTSKQEPSGAGIDKYTVLHDMYRKVGTHFGIGTTIDPKTSSKYFVRFLEGMAAATNAEYNRLFEDPQTDILKLKSKKVVEGFDEALRKAFPSTCAALP